MGGVGGVATGSNGGGPSARCAWGWGGARCLCAPADASVLALLVGVPARRPARTIPFDASGLRREGVGEDAAAGFAADTLDRPLPLGLEDVLETAGADALRSGVAPTRPFVTVEPGVLAEVRLRLAALPRLLLPP